MDIKLNTGAPLDRSLIPDPEFKVGDKVFCVRPYFSNVRLVEILEFNLSFTFTDNGYSTYYERKITYETRCDIGNHEQYDEDDLYSNLEDAENALIRHKKDTEKYIKSARDNKIKELTKDLERLIKLRDEQEQGQGTSDGTSNSEDVSTILPISENSQTSK